MDNNEILEKLTEAINEDSWAIIEELIEELFSLCSSSTITS